MKKKRVLNGLRLTAAWQTDSATKDSQRIQTRRTELRGTERLEVKRGVGKEKGEGLRDLNLVCNLKFAQVCRLKKRIAVLKTSTAETSEKKEGSAVDCSGFPVSQWRKRCVAERQFPGEGKERTTKKPYSGLRDGEAHALR